MGDPHKPQGGQAQGDQEEWQERDGEKRRRRHWLENYLMMLTEL